jgi:hypothetical protein
MYCILNCYNCFLNFVIQKMNYKMVKCVIVVLTRRQKTEVTDVDMVVDWMLYTVAGVLVIEWKRKN